MTTPRETRDYLLRLRAGLAPLPQSERDEIVRETESHLLDRLTTSSDVDAAAVLADLGEPEDYAAQFVTNYRISAALASGSPLAQVAQVVRMLGTGLRAFAAGFVVVTLGALTMGFLAVAVMKPILPDQTGLFVGPGHFGLGIFDSRPAANGTEVLGLWVIPIAVVGAGLCALAAGFVARVFLKRARRGPR
jgi:uncharacterized membrane protein